jgi:hypothetical protein
VLSWVNALSGPRNVGLGVASVEWLRQNGGNSLVSEIENEYYTLTAPSKGGPPLHSLPQVGIAAAGEGDRGVTAYRPPNVVPLIHPALPGEGVWKKAAANADPRPPVLLTTFRSDPEYPQFIAGSPGSTPRAPNLPTSPAWRSRRRPWPTPRGPAEVPHSMRKRVVATFNGGFPPETSNAGLIYRGKVVEAMVNGVTTVVEYRDGRVDIVKWESGSGAPANVWFAKQNLPPIVDDGKLNPNLSDGPEWGETVNNAVRVWRSGIGIDSHGNLLYAAANYQTVESLAKVLQRAGAVRALELDINEDWTSFITYRHPGAGEPSNLLPEMLRPPERYLTPDERDFFAVYLHPKEKW